MKAYIRPRPLDGRTKKEMLPLIKNEILKHQDIYYTANCAAILWALHECFGYGEERLKKFWNCYFKIHEEVTKEYQLDDNETGTIYIDRLRRIGVDIDKWIKEVRK